MKKNNNTPAGKTRFDMPDLLLILTIILILLLAILFAESDIDVMKSLSQNRILLFIESVLKNG